MSYSELSRIPLMPITIALNKVSRTHPLNKGRDNFFFKQCRVFLFIPNLNTGFNHATFWLKKKKLQWCSKELEI